MKKVIWSLCLSLVGLGVVSAVNFPDIYGNEYSQSIQYIAEKGVVSGYPDGTFGPDREITRAEILKIILESSKDGNIGEGEKCFPDVQNQRYAKYVCYAKLMNIVKGYPDGSFKPDQTVTNAEALKMTLESFGYSETAAAGERRYDGYLNFVHDHDIFSKYAIRPDKNMTRAEMSYLTHQFMMDANGEKKLSTTRDTRSPGCGQTPPSSAPTSVRVAGQQRNFIVDMAKSYNQNTPAKLVLAFHGRTNSNSELRGYLHLDRVVDGNTIVIYPSALPENSSPRSRQNGGDPKDQLRDFELFDKIVEEYSNKYCIDEDQIYVVGHSLGAWFTNSLSCARGDVIRAIGSIGGSTTINDCSGPVSAMIMHNPSDRLAGFEGGITARNQMLAQNGCSSATIALPGGPDKGNCVKYTDCQDGAEVVRCPHTEDYPRGSYYPHGRPSFATPAIRNFFMSLD